jgi:hypothetical protein
MHENKKFFLLEWAGPDPKKKLGRDQPNKIQTILYWAGLNPTAWTELMIQPGLVVVPVHSNQPNTITWLLCMSTVTG